MRAAIKALIAAALEAPTPQEATSSGADAMNILEGLTQEERAARATFYAMYLRQVEGLDPDEAAALVKERYPGACTEPRRKPPAFQLGGEL